MAVYFTLELAIKQHDKIIEISGGLEGIKDKGQLDSSLKFIEDDVYYPTFTDKLTHLVFSVAMNHCFNDGNKRSSIVLGAYFLEINGYGNLVEVFIVEMENIVLWVANKFINKDELAVFIESIVVNGGLTDENKLKIASILTKAGADISTLKKPNVADIIVI
jgi:death-on-curing protein